MAWLMKSGVGVLVSAAFWGQLPGSATAADTLFDVPEEPSYKYFDMASHDFGEGIVQLHTRKEGSSGITHTVHHIDCVGKRYDDIFAGEIKNRMGFRWAQASCPPERLKTIPSLSLWPGTPARSTVTPCWNGKI